MESQKARATVRRVPIAYRVSRIAVFSALTVIGSFIHLPGPIQTVALDSSPGFFAALFFGAADGAFVCGIGHIATAAVNGFPLGILHFPIALGLAAAGATIGLFNRLRFSWSSVLGLVMGVTINTGLVIVAVPAVGWEVTLTFAPFLLFAATLNAAVAGLIYAGVRGKVGL